MTREEIEWTRKSILSIHYNPCSSDVNELCDLALLGLEHQEPVPPALKGFFSSASLLMKKDTTRRTKQRVNDNEAAFYNAHTELINRHQGYLDTIQKSCRHRNKMNRPAWATSILGKCCADCGKRL